MKVGDLVVITGLLKTKHLNGKLASIVKKHEGDRWIVHLDGTDDAQVCTRFYICLDVFVIVVSASRKSL